MRQKRVEGSPESDKQEPRSGMKILQDDQCINFSLAIKRWARRLGEPIVRKPSWIVEGLQMAANIDI
jgi:hypothetical protein